MLKMGRCIMKDDIRFDIKENGINNLPSARIKLIRDSQSRPVRLSLISSNDSFDYLIDHKMIQGETDWLSLFDSFSSRELYDFFDLRLSHKEKTYPMLVVVTDKDLFNLYIFDSSHENKQYTMLNKILNISEEFLQYDEPVINYQKIVDDFLVFCSGKYSVFNLFSASGTTFTTKAISGDKGLIKKISKLLGYNLIGKEWPYDPVYLERISHSNITYFKDLYDIVGSVIPKPIIFIIENMLNLGEIVVIKIMKNEKTLGEFTVFMDKETNFIDQSIANIYTKQVGLFITRMKLEQDIKKEKNFLKTTLLSIDEGVIATDSSGTILFANNAAETLIGLPFKKIYNSNIDRIYKTIDEFSKTETKSLMNVVINQKATVHGNTSTLLVSHNGNTCPIEQSASPLFDDHGELIGIVFVFRDVYDKKTKQDEIYYLSFHDQLTGLYNRRFYEEELSRLDNERHLPLSVIIADIDGLKLINDSFGHPRGDQLIIKASKAIKTGIRSSDIVARIGGDEFIVLLPSTEKKQVKEVTERIKKLAEKESVEATTLSISFGYGIKYTSEEDMNDIIKKADDMMYKQKLYNGSTIRRQTIDQIMKILFEKNEREMKHTERVSDLCGAIASELNCNSNYIEQIKLAGLLHDIGKIGINENILNKVKRLSADEWELVKRHSEIGYRILSSVNEFSEVANYVLEHHEKYDGTGYPRGLKGDDISLQARIISVADSFDTMTNNRIYGRALTKKEAILELKRCSGTQFDPFIVDVFIEKIIK